MSTQIPGAAIDVASYPGIDPSGNLSSAGAFNQAIQDAANAPRGPLPVYVRPGDYVLDGTLTPATGVRIFGDHKACTSIGTASGLPLFNMALSAALSNVEIDHLSLWVTGADLFSGVWVNRLYLHDCSLTQNSAGHALWNATTSGSQVMLECRFERNSETVNGATRSIEAWIITGTGASNQLNQNVWRDNVCTNAGGDTTQYWYHLVNSGDINGGNSFHNIVFENPVGGMIHLESAKHSEIDCCLAYDLSGTIGNSLIYISKNSGGTAPTQNVIRNSPRNASGGTFGSGNSDIQLDSNCTATTIICPSGGLSTAPKIDLGSSATPTILGLPASYTIVNAPAAYADLYANLKTPGTDEAASANFKPSSPTATSSTSEVMMGLGDSGSQTTPVQYTPADSGILLVNVTAYTTNATAVTGNTVGPRYGPVYGPAATVAAGSNGGEISQIASWSSPSAGVLDVGSTAGYASSGTIWVATSGGVAQVTYTGKGTGTFTGCAYVSGSATGTVATGGAVNGAPQNGTPVVGTRFGCSSDTLVKPPGVGQYAAVAYTDRLALTPGQAYWFDLALQTGNGSDAASLINISATIAEIPW